MCASTWRVCVVSVTCALIEDYNGDGEIGGEGGQEKRRDRAEQEQDGKRRGRERERWRE